MSLSNIGKLAAVYALVQLVDFKDANNVAVVRQIYVGVQAACWVVMLYIFIRIKMARNKVEVQALKPPGFGADPNEDPAPYTTTVEEYHLQELQALMGKLAIPTMIVNLIFYKWQLIPPLCMQCLLNPQQVMDNNLFNIYIKGISEKEYPIPWDQTNPMDFGKMFAQQGKDAHIKKQKEKSLKEMRAANLKAIKADKKLQ
eukprot:TRINITY_DN5943_c0_g5_i1.p2 TRINITY_DN5943_c0_g5~~TRINITY_DN5943_c0_g5_i1.p2  ORF type:complete len:200 (+),score=60.73 TRINITY_DN5943_c0_g5_i1:56-655(+)